MKNKILIITLYSLTSFFMVAGIFFILMLIGFMLPIEYTISGRMYTFILLALTATIYITMMKLISKANI